ncbi:MAG: hypothetical protein ACM3TT_12585 [Syntrophothermus sp.]
MVESTINAQTKSYLRAGELAEIIKMMEFPKEYAAQIYNFFADVPLQDIDRFATTFGVADAVLKRYYQVFVKDIYPNPELEEMLRYAQ